MRRMSLPTYLKITGIRRGPDGYEMGIRVRTWHPSFWRMLVREVLREADRRGVSRWHPRRWWLIARMLVTTLGGR
jgi:hypothetical protein